MATIDLSPRDATALAAVLGGTSDPTAVEAVVEAVRSLDRFEAAVFCSCVLRSQRCIDAADELAIPEAVLRRGRLSVLGRLARCVSTASGGQFDGLGSALDPGDAEALMSVGVTRLSDVLWHADLRVLRQRSKGLRGEQIESIAVALGRARRERIVALRRQLGCGGAR